MFLNLNHQTMDVYVVSRKFVCECYKMARALPPEERFALSSQIRRAALSVHLNIAEGCSRKSMAERKRFYEVARGSVVEIDGALDVASDLQLFDPSGHPELGNNMIRCFSMLSKLIGVAN